MAHTQGEWKIGKGEIFRPASSGSISPYWKQICSFVETADKECEANKKLIAAAPEMLEALISLKEYCKYDEIRLGSGIIHQIETAISKATE